MQAATRRGIGADTGANHVLTTGTGPGGCLAHIVPIVDHVLRRGSGVSDARRE